jgi:acetyltransferase-like isoleucine patch superfamily enzyme
MKQSWSVVVFCFNEVGTIEELVDRIVGFFETHRKGLYEVIIVDDGSTDGSYDKIRDAAQKHEKTVRIIRHEKNLGIGEALRDGYAAARNENVTAVPADGQFDIEELLPYLDIEPGTFISFYRRENAEYTSFRNALSVMNKYINRVFNGIALRDVNWVKIHKREAISAFPWKLHSSLIESELCSKLLLTHNRPIEVLSYYHSRRAGTSKGASLRIVAQALRETPKLIFAVYTLRKSMKSMKVTERSGKKKLRDVRVGENVRIFDFVNLYECEIGDDSRIGTFVEIQKGAMIGKNCKISSHSFICEGVTIEDNVFIGHGVVFTNDKRPRAVNADGIMQSPEDWTLIPTVVKSGASIGSNVTILPGITIGEHALIGAGAVVTKDVPAHSTVVGNPARPLRE